MQECLHKWNEETIVSSFPASVERVFPESPGDNPRSQEEHQFLRRSRNAGPLEEMPDQRQAAHERNLLDVRALRGDDDAADYDGTAIRHGHLGFRRLGIKSRDSRHARDTCIDLRILNEHI